MLQYEQICEMYDKLVSHICSYIPKFEVLSHSSSNIIKVLKRFFKFYNNCTVSLYPKIYFPTLTYPNDGDPNYNTLKQIIIISHEFTHLKDRKKFGILFNVAYLFPQILSLFALLSFFNIWWLFALIFLLPIPAPFRMYFEFKAYVVNIAMEWWLLNEEPNIENYVKKFSSSTYYYMWPFKNMLRKKFTSAYVDILKGNVNRDLQEIYNIYIGVKK